MILRKIRYGAFIVFIVALVGVLYLSLIGLPDVLARNIEKRLQFSDLVVTLAKVKLGVFEGIIATHVLLPQGRYWRSLARSRKNSFALSALVLAKR